MKIGIDLDGAINPIKLINPSLKLPQFLYILVAPFGMILPPSEKTAKMLKKLALKNQIIIISARPPWFKAITEKWLRFYSIPFDKVYCVGFGKGTKKRKLQIIKKENIKIFIDDDKKILDLLNKNSIKTIKV